ncbi:type IV secretion protein Rhs [Xanthomonas sp. AmX2]|uniref:RHS repeat-associated core domain-containing protein n=1 Tax=Xanthomonas sp. TaxID=29446 RepID=UPI001981EE47|nr:RHS repeat-associated core domain-containing protein [Xanthomonas sp.]MBN6151933.1 type IV secretion protein Rhs [Xanthomonas sp.]
MASLFGAASAQDFSRIPALTIYGAPLVDRFLEVPNIGCEMTAVFANSTQGPFYPGWVEFINPRYTSDFLRDGQAYGPGCIYDLVYHGGFQGNPEGYVERDSYGQNHVYPTYYCPTDYVYVRQYNPDGSESSFCSRPLFSESKSGSCLREKIIGNPISCNTGRKIEYATDAQFGTVAIKRVFRSGGRWPGLRVSSEFGDGWNGLFNARISYVPATQYSEAVVYAFRHDGTVLPFLSGDDDAWVGEVDTLATVLLENRDESGEIIGWTLKAADGVEEMYDREGLLLTVKRDGVPEMVLNRSSSGKLLSLSDAQGRKAPISHDSNGRIDRINLPDGQSVKYGYDVNNRLVSVDRMGHVIAYQYVDVSGRQGVYLSAVVDEDGRAFAEFDYSQDGKAVGTKHIGDVDKYVISYSDDGGGANVAFPSGRVEKYEFESMFGVRRLVSSSIDCVGCPDGGVAYTYDASGYANTVTDALGSITDYDYGINGVLNQKAEAANDAFGNKRVTQIDWHPELRVPLERRNYDASGALIGKSARTYNSRGQVLTFSATDPMTGINRTTRTTYCEQPGLDAGACPLLGLVTSTDGTRSDVSDLTRYNYYAADDEACGSTMTCPHRKGDLWKVTTSTGQVTEYLSYDGAGRVLSVKDANGIITDYTYHPRGWLTASKVRGADDSAESDDRITRIDYWPTGLVKRVTQPDGSFTSFTYDGAHRLTDIADGAGNTLHYTLDNAGNRVKEDTKDASGALKRTLSRVYNQLGQLATQATAKGDPTDFSYDSNGNTKTVTDALGRVTQNDYDPLSRLTRTLQDVGGIAAETKFAYDALDNLTKVTDPKGLDTSYEYNGFGDLTMLTSPDTGTTSYTYDSAGNRASQTDARGITTTYSYDALNRLTHVAYPDSELGVTYTYDISQSVCASGETFAVGRLAKMQDGGAITQYCYDRFGDLVRKVQTTNGHALVLRYAYTKAGQLSRLTYPDGAVVDYVRNAQGQTTEVGVTPAGGARQVLLGNATYYPFGPVAGWSYGNGRPMQRLLDQDYRPLAISDSRSDGLGVGFAFDPAGNLDALTAPGNAAPVMSLGYDALGRLTEFKDGPTGAVIDGYSYDATGNRLSAKVNGATQAYAYPATSHRLSAVAGTARTYDAVGNTTAIGGTARQYVYDATGRMSQAKRAGQLAMNYRYNGRGEQVRRFLGTANTYTLYDEAGNWIGDYGGDGQPIQQAIWMGGIPVGLLSNNNKLSYIVPDHVGTPRAVVDPVRDVFIWSWNIKGEAYGATSPSQDTDNDGVEFLLDMRFPGQRFDAFSGLNYNYFRSYDFSSGRYTQSDKAGLASGYSTFSYVNADPLGSVDENGLQSRSVARPNPGGVGGVGYSDPDYAGLDGHNKGYGAPAVQLPTVSGVLAGFLQFSSALPVASVAGQSVAIAQNLCPDGGEDECDRLRAKVRAAKAAVSVVGACRVGMSWGQLAVRHRAWVELAAARAQRDQKCYAGGDDGHQQAQADAWQNAGACNRMMSGM